MKKKLNKKKIRLATRIEARSKVLIKRAKNGCNHRIDILHINAAAQSISHNTSG